MNLTVREAAALLQTRPRTLRGRLERGEIPGEKRGNRWILSTDALPMTEDQRRRLQQRVEEAHRAVDRAAPEKMAGENPAPSRGHTLLDHEVFRVGALLVRQMRAASPPPRTLPLLEAALDRLAEAVHHYDRARKIRRLHACRDLLARTAARTLVDLDPGEPASPQQSWMRELEGRLLPMVGGLTRSLETPPRPSLGARDRRRSP